MQLNGPFRIDGPQGKLDSKDYQCIGIVFVFLRRFGDRKTVMYSKGKADEFDYLVLCSPYYFVFEILAGQRYFTA